VCPACQTSYVIGEASCRTCGKRSRGNAWTLSPKSLVLGIVLVVVLLVSGACFYLDRRITQSAAYQDSIKKALASAEIREVLGTNIEQSPALGFTIPYENTEFMEWSVKVKGTRGAGHIYGVANRINAVWDLTWLVFRSEDGKLRVNFPLGRLRSLPPAPAKNVYIVPIGLDQSQSVDWAPAYYKSMLGINVDVLPSVAISPDLIDQTRNQLNAERCVDFMQEKYPDLARDPSSIMVAIVSSDMYIPGLGWSYAENFRSNGRFAIISSARLHPLGLLEKLNPEWLNSRIQKLLTKNLAMLYFDLPMSSDYTSVLSGGVLSGWQIDRMGGRIIGGEGKWDSFFVSGDPETTIYDIPGKNLLWRRTFVHCGLRDSATQAFSADLGIGLLVQRKADLSFEDEAALQFCRVYRNQDDRSRSFGIGGSNSFDMFLGGQMGVAVDLILEDGTRVHFVHQPPRVGEPGDLYLADEHSGARFADAEAVFLGDAWQVRTTDGWTYFFPYRPKALPQYVTVLTGFMDPAHQKYEMERDGFGSLLEVNSPSGKWLRFENDAEHRIRRITSSVGRSVQYDYDDGGHLIRVTNSEGDTDAYTYDDRGQMLTAAHGDEKPFLAIEYFPDGYIKSETMDDGKQFSFSYFRELNHIYESQIIDPNGFQTSIQYSGSSGYIQSLPAPRPQPR
jgi:YD repeat-containing protein